ncbi:MAG: hypothetical protein RIT32_863 [Actinomycetota bacterium]|jgi:hypothetical protein
MQLTKTFSLLFALLLTTGCATGFDAATQLQGPTGNGRYLTIGDLSVQNLTVVAGESNAALLMKIFNDTVTADRLVDLSINNQSVLSDVAVPANTKVAYGNTTNPALTFPATITPGGYVPIKMQFERAGIYEATVLVVPPTNQYAGIVN